MLRILVLLQIRLHKHWSEIVVLLHFNQKNNYVLYCFLFFNCKPVNLEING